MINKLISLALVLLIMTLMPMHAFAAENVDGGGGDLGSGTNQNRWTPGCDGVRITIVDEETDKPVTKSVDFVSPLAEQ